MTIYFLRNMTMNTNIFCLSDNMFLCSFKGKITVLKVTSFHHGAVKFPFIRFKSYKRDVSVSPPSALNESIGLQTSL